MSQCKHWRIPLFLFASPASEKKCKRIPYSVRPGGAGTGGRIPEQLMTPHPSSALRGIGGCHLPLKGKALANPNQRASRRSRDRVLDKSAEKVTAENCRFAGTSSTASGPPSPCAGKAWRIPTSVRPGGEREPMLTAGAFSQTGCPAARSPGAERGRFRRRPRYRGCPGRNPPGCRRRDRAPGPRRGPGWR